MYSRAVLLLLLYAFSYAFTAAAMQVSSFKLLKHGGCKNLWRPGGLVGKCFGLKKMETFEGLADIVVKSSDDCRALCCNLGENCTSWQFQLATKTCKLGDAVRVGLEDAATDNWCDPFSPSEWNGRRVMKRENGVCDWGDLLPNQCFGLGPERTGINNQRLDTRQCAEACCATATCDMWQQQNGRGCYFGPSQDVACDTTRDMPYEGGRKCVPGFCGSLAEQNQILSRYNRTHHQRSSISN